MMEAHQKGQGVSRVNRHEEGKNLLRQRWIEARYRLIRKKDSRVLSQRASDGHALHLPAGEGARLAIQLVIEVNFFDGRSAAFPIGAL